MAEWINSDGSVGWMKKKHETSKTKGRYSGGPRPAPLKKRGKKGAKTYKYGSVEMVLLASGKRIFRKVVS